MKRAFILLITVLVCCGLAISQTHVPGISHQCTTCVTNTSVLPNNPPAGSAVLVSISGNTVSALTCHDGATPQNNYTTTPGSPNTHLGQNVWLAYLALAPANADKNIICSWTTSGTENQYADIFTSVSGCHFVFDKEAESNGNTGTNINTPTLTPTSFTGCGGVGALLYAAAQSQAIITAPTANGGTLGVWTGATGPYIGNNGVEYCLSCTGATAVSMTQTNNDIWTASEMAFSEVPDATGPLWFGR